MKKLFLTCLLLSSPVLQVSANERPNVLVVLFDDLGFSDLGCYGGEISTPHIDGLARNGLRFTGMTNSARCCPSRASLLTGLHPSQAGIPNMGGSLSSSCVTLAEVLKGAGYRTYGVGKWHVGEGDALPTARGFDEYYGYTKGHSADQWSARSCKRLPESRKPELSYADEDFYATDVFSDYAMEFLTQAHEKEKPWFLYLAHSSPHFPVQAPMKSAEPFVETYRKGWDVLRKERFDRMKGIGLCDHDGWKLTSRSLVPVEKNNAIANGYSGKPNPAWDSLAPERREDLAHRMALFAAMVEHVDRGMGRIVRLLEEKGSLENTLILLLSDNGACYEWGPFGFDGKSRAGKTTLHQGEDLKTMGGPGSYMSYGSAWANLGNTPFRLYKHFTHEGGMVTPFIVHWPSGVKKADRWVRDPAHIMDVMPTLVEACGAEYLEGRKGVGVTPMEGVSLVPAFQDGALADRSLCYQHQGARAIRKGDFKLVYGKKFPQEVAWELYNVAEDPCETNNLATKMPEKVKALTSEWEAWETRVGLKGSTKSKKQGAKGNK